MQSINQLITNNDWFFVPIYLIGIFLLGGIIKVQNQKKFPEYKYFLTGLVFKILGVSSFILIYLFYYEGGDTVNYFVGSKALSDLAFIDFNRYYDIVVNNNLEWNNYVVFNSNTWYPPWYMWKDPKTFSVCRFTSFLCIISFNSFIVTSFFTACISYIGIWKIYRLFNIQYPNNEKILAYLILFLPTLIFWGGGIMKDSYVLGSTCWITYNFYQTFINRRKIFINSLLILFNGFIIINTKSYVLVSLIPGTLLWLNNSYLSGIKSNLAKFAVFPIIISCIIFAGIFLIQNLSGSMGVYGDVDTALEQAQIIQEDLLREDQYGGNNYDLGSLDNSFLGLISVAPIAVITALFRPFLWEIGSATMVLSAIENTILLVFTSILLMRISPIRLLRILFKEPFLMYCFMFSIFFAFGVGIAGTNFGALVRYKTPLVPFFFSMIFMLYKNSNLSR